MKTEGILVSICCVTYNHEEYIRQCLNGFVMQKTNFAFEILVHEDASTDATAKIVKEYELRYPHLIRCVYQSENQFLKQNTLVNILFKMAKGKYIALCEGDDYWTDPYKLQKQLDFLEANPEYSFCVANTRIVDSQNNTIVFKELKAGDLQLKDFIEGNIIGGNTCTAVIRKEVVTNKYFNKITASPFGDWAIWLFCLENYKGHLLGDTMACYRVHNTGMWSGSSNKIKVANYLKMYKYISDNYPEYKKHIAIYSTKYKIKKTSNNLKKLFLKVKLKWYRKYYSMSQI